MIRSIFLNILLILTCAYFGFHLIWGQKGYINYLELKQSFQTKTQEFEKIQAQKVILEDAAKALYKNSIDLDALDEYVRKNLALAKPEEFLVSQRRK
jgi:cell division protein FtsB